MGGAENLVCNLADQFAARGHGVQLISLLGEPVVLPQDTSIRVHNLRIDKRKPVTWFAGLAYFIAAIRAFQPDVVHAHSFHSIMLARLLRPLLRYPKLISTGHHQREGEGFEGLLYRLTDKLSDIMTTISDSTTSAVLQRTGLALHRVITVSNGIDAELFQFSKKSRWELRRINGLHEDDRVLVAIGRLSQEKDFPNLLHALKEVENRGALGHNLFLLIVGTGPQEIRQQLEGLVRELDLRTKVIFLGVRRDIPALLSAADIFVLSSAWEGFGLVVAEAMACERVVVATDSGGVREVIGDAGFLCPPQDSAALGSAIQAALALSEEERQLLGKQARARIVEHYSLDSAAERWLTLYRTL